MADALGWLADHVRLVTYAVQRAGAGDLDDAWGIAALGLVKAARTYDPQRGPWPAYALRCMHNELRMAWRARGTVDRHEWLGMDAPVPHWGADAPPWGAVQPDPADPLTAWEDARPLYDWAAVAAAVARAPWRVRAYWADCVRYPHATRRERAQRLGWHADTVTRARRRLQAVVARALAAQQRAWSA